MSFLHFPCSMMELEYHAYTRLARYHNAFRGFRNTDQVHYNERGKLDIFVGHTDTAFVTRKNKNIKKQKISTSLASYFTAGRVLFHSHQFAHNFPPKPRCTRYRSLISVCVWIRISRVCYKGNANHPYVRATEGLGDKNAIVHQGDLILRVPDYIVTISCNVVVLTCCVMCGCFGNMYTCIYCVLYCLYCVFCFVSFMYIYSYRFVCTSVRTTATE